MDGNVNFERKLPLLKYKLYLYLYYKDVSDNFYNLENFMSSKAFIKKIALVVS